MYSIFPFGLYINIVMIFIEGNYKPSIVIDCFKHYYTQSLQQNSLVLILTVDGENMAYSG